MSPWYFELSVIHPPPESAQLDNSYDDDDNFSRFYIIPQHLIYFIYLES